MAWRRKELNRDNSVPHFEGQHKKLFQNETIWEENNKQNVGNVQSLE